MSKHLQRMLLALVLLAATALAFLYRDRFDAETLEEWVGSAGAAAPLLFMALYTAATVLFVPGSVMTLAGGALFGPVAGAFYNLTGATLGAALAFLIALPLGAVCGWLWWNFETGRMTSGLISMVATAFAVVASGAMASPALGFFLTTFAAFLGGLLGAALGLRRELDLREQV